MAKPDAGEPHQLLRTHGQRPKRSRQLNVLNQQTVQQTKDQHSKQTETELEQPQLHPQSELPNQGLIAKAR